MWSGFREKFLLLCTLKPLFAKLKKACHAISCLIRETLWHFSIKINLQSSIPKQVIRRRGATVNWNMIPKYVHPCCSANYGKGFKLVSCRRRCFFSTEVSFANEGTIFFVWVGIRVDCLLVKILAPIPPLCSPAHVFVEPPLLIGERGLIPRGGGGGGMRIKKTSSLLPQKELGI